MKMLKIAILSLLSGSLLTLASLSSIYWLQTDTSDALPVIWNAKNIRPSFKAGKYTSEGLRLRLDRKGETIITLPMQSLHTEDYAFLHLYFSKLASQSSASILWKTARGGAKTFAFNLPGYIQRSTWISTDEMKGWAGDITSMAILFKGRSTDEIIIKEIKLLPSSFQNQLETLVSDWNTFSPWSHSSVNFYTGTRTLKSTFYPVPVVATVIFMSILSYAILLFIFRTRLRFDWQVLATLFLIGWISLDLIWQSQLNHQLNKTYQIFAGKTVQEKLAAGPDADLVSFITEIRQHLQQLSSDPNIFVSSSDDYLGMRGSYYLYPYNVYWSRSDIELPARKNFHAGDYIVQIKPSQIRFNKQDNTLQLPDKDTLNVQQVFSHPLGRLFKVR